MVDKAKNFIKESLNNLSEPLDKAEKAVEKAYERLVQNINKLDKNDVRKVFDELKKKVQTARVEVEAYLNTGMDKALGAINVPSRKEVDVIKADLAQLSNEVKAMKKGAAPKKPAAKKPVAKKSVKKSAKKAKK